MFDVLKFVRDFPTYNAVLDTIVGNLNGRCFMPHMHDRSIRKIGDRRYQLCFSSRIGGPREYVDITLDFAERFWIVKCGGMLMRFDRERPGVLTLRKFVRHLERDFYRELNDNLTDVDIRLRLRYPRFVHAYSESGHRLGFDNLDC